MYTYSPTLFAIDENFGSQTLDPPQLKFAAKAEKNRLWLFDLTRNKMGVANTKSQWMKSLRFCFFKWQGAVVTARIQFKKLKWLLVARDFLTVNNELFIYAKN